MDLTALSSFRILNLNAGALLVLFNPRELDGRLRDRSSVCIVRIWMIDLEIKKLLELVILEISEDCYLSGRATILVSDVVSMELELFQSRVRAADL